ncbi:hypothetical protein M0804_007987 [Polistes exclamans]|nr:hypothetical protein M0804_007987 [Polistes exclamans]
MNENEMLVVFGETKVNLLANKLINNTSILFKPMRVLRMHIYLLSAKAIGVDYERICNMSSAKVSGNEENGGDGGGGGCSSGCSGGGCGGSSGG